MPWVVEILKKANLHTVPKKAALAKQWVMNFCAEEEDLLDSSNLFALEEFSSAIELTPFQSKKVRNNLLNAREPVADDLESAWSMGDIVDGQQRLITMTIIQRALGAPQVFAGPGGVHPRRNG